MTKEQFESFFKTLNEKYNFKDNYNKELYNPKPLIIPLQCFTKKQIAEINEAINSRKTSSSSKKSI